MILRLKIQRSKKKNKNNRITVWIQNSAELKEDLNQIFQFFQENIKISKRIRLHKYYKVSSETPAILLSLVSTINDLIPEIFFNSKDSIEETELLNIKNF